MTPPYRGIEENLQTLLFALPPLSLLPRWVREFDPQRPPGKEPVSREAS